MAKARKKKNTAKRKSKARGLPKTKPKFYFRVVDGSEIKDLVGLADAIGKMGDDVFYYHVNKHKNDFSNWVRGIFKEDTLADEIRNSSSRLEMEVSILRFLVKRLAK
jgi:oligoribonuclease (3'-5' exoribonuclease)